MSSSEMKQRSPSADTPAKAAVEAAPGVPPHVLALDDDPDLRDLLREFLPRHDLRTTTVATGTEMLRVLEQEPVDILLIDLRLPHEDGLALARKVREQSSIPIIILTGKTDEADRVMGLELAADDYVTKPFSPRELVARVRALLRRTQQDPAGTNAANPRAYRFAGWELNLRRRRLTNPSGDPVELTNSEFNLLSAFLAAPQRVLTRDQLLERSRLHSLEVYDRAIDVTILRLRRKIEVDYTDPQLIVTERGAGYVFTQPVNVLR